MRQAEGRKSACSCERDTFNGIPGMKIACVEQTAAERIKLQKLIDNAYDECRHSIGHLVLVHTYTATKEELLLSSSPEIIALSACTAIESSFSCCRELSEAFPNTPIILFLPDEHYSLRTLRRFEKYVHTVFPLNESAVRIVHTLSSLANSHTKATSGKLIYVAGVKGGVGTSSVVSGLLHSADATGKSSVLIDLSSTGALIQYMFPERWQSPDYTATLVDGLAPDKSAVERSITVAPNGVHILLPPAGGSDIRELWLRSPTTFEWSLAVVDILQDMFDLVIIDSAQAEGVLPFALMTRSHSVLLVTSNDPASVHLLNTQLNSIAETPGSFQIHILMNMLRQNGLTDDDILDFLSANDRFEDSMTVPEPLLFDSRGSHWIGSGNTFYTEAAKSTQLALERLLKLVTATPQELASGTSNSLRSLWNSSLQHLRLSPPTNTTPPRLPFLQGYIADGFPLVDPINSSASKTAPEVVFAPFIPSQENLTKEPTLSPVPLEPDPTRPKETLYETTFFCPPQLVTIKQEHLNDETTNHSTTLQ